MILFVLFIIACLGYYFEVSFDYVGEDDIFLIFFTAANRERKCIKIKF